MKAWLMMVLVLLASTLVAEPVKFILGPIVTAQQSQPGSYWLQLAALKKAPDLQQMQSRYPGLTLALHSDDRGLNRLLAGPYANYQMARQQLRSNNLKAIIRYAPGGMPTALQKMQAECATAASPGQCACCLHIRNGELVDYLPGK